MRVGVLTLAQHSMFSSGIANTSLAIAEIMREFGHEVDLIQAAGKAAWWDDCKTLNKHWNIIGVDDAKGYDILFEIDRLNLPNDKRKQISQKTILILRKPFILQEMEATLFPTTQTPKREFAGLSEIWMMDAAAEMEEGVVQALELLSSVPVRIVPYTWSPNIASAHIQETGLGSWLTSTVAELKKIDTTGATMPPWKFHIAETNTTNASCAVLPLVILREAKRRGTNIGKWYAHNTDMITKSKFFMENIVKNCTDSEVGLSGEFIGRQRCVEWINDPMSCVLSHMRFTAIRPMLLDVAWAGIPLVHNSPMLRDIGLGLERSYYSDNHVGEACEAIRRMEEDLVTIKGIFSPDAINLIRVELLAKFSPISANVKIGWEKALKGLNMVAPPIVSVAPPIVSVAPPTPSKIFRVGFCDMWEDFNPVYNFFILMLANANPSVQVIGGPASPEDNVVIFGPFGFTWKTLPAEQPKIHFTGENTQPVPEANLNLGFHHFDMMDDRYLRFPLWLLEIDWFNADPSQIVNPKPIPLERCTKVFVPELAQKKNFCAFVVSNPGNPIRNAAFQWLSEYKHVDSAGRLFNNMGPDLFAGGGGGGGEIKKLEFLKNYKFCLAYENNSARGYTTEKYLHAKAAGCIPIYWGDPTIERDFNPAGCIDARSFKSPEELIEAVKRVDTDDAEWLKRFAVPALDPYRVAWAHRTMAECAKRIFNLGGFDVSSFALVVPVATATVTAIATVTAQEPEIPHMVTCATRKYLPSLQHWLVSIATQIGAMPALKATVFLSSDIPEDTVKALTDKFTFATFEILPDSTPPANSFSDFWEPQHFGWKLWIFNEMCSRQNLSGKMIFYTDAGAFLCRWPKAWMLQAQSSGICFLEDPREENKRWCSPEFSSIVNPTDTELAAQQRLGGLVIFRAGAPLPMKIFHESLALGKQRRVLVGDKWSGIGSDGKPFGHRHDQSILSIISLRHSAPVHPLDSVYCDASLRKTFTSGKSIYVHRGNFQVHKPFSNKIDDAFVINLDRRADRLERLWSNCPELQGRVERWSAIEGTSLQLTPALKRLLKPNDFFWKKAVSGCALSHLGLWWKLANENPDIENYLILEDDVKFKTGWENLWKGAVENDEMPEDYDIIYLGGVLPPNRETFEKACKERVNDSFCRVKENTVWGQNTPNRYFHFCAYAYILSKRGAQKVLDLIRSADGYWTSADHILCNPVSVLKAYVFDPIVAGCYQDDDPKYANSKFNDFSRIDGFDSDLWNNDERFEACDASGDIDIDRALKDARNPTVATTVAVPVIPKGDSKTFTELPKRFVCLSGHNLHIKQLYECDWLLDLFGNPSTFVIDKIRPESPPPTDAPVVIMQQPWIESITTMLEKWDSFGVKYSILHLSDEHLTDDISAYSFSGCEKVLRFYKRPDTNAMNHVSTIPLGYHWTLPEGSKNMLTLTPRLPFRGLTWSFFGTDWNGRRKELDPLYTVKGKYESQFFKDWNDSSAIPKEEYISSLLDTVFVPCPDGQNPETFRFYEALECGCLPILVRTERNATWVDWVCENLQILPINSWTDAAKLMDELLDQKQMLEAYRTKVLEGWMGWRLKLRAEMAEWLSS